MSTLDKLIKFLGELGKALMFFSVVGFAGSMLMRAAGSTFFTEFTKPVAVLSVFVFFAAFALTERMKRFAASRTQRHSKIREKADALALQGKYAEAAEFYTRQAQKEIKHNELTFAYYCKCAFQMWGKAREPGKALNEARNVLWIYINNNGRWLRHESGDYFEDLTAMVSDFFAAGYTSEGAVLAGEVNHQLEKYGLPMRCATVAFHKNIFPVSCTDCGANLSHTPYQDTAQCGYCKAIIYPLNPLFKIEDENANRARTANIVAVNAAADAANRSVTAERRIILPPAKPIEKGNRQKFYANTISFTVPENWKSISTTSYEWWNQFRSPDHKFSFKLSVFVVREKKGDMMQEFNKISTKKPETKVLLQVLDGDTLGIFTLSKDDKTNFEINSIIWESFAPPNARGETNLLKITMTFPAGEFELHKQLISDIYGSFKIRK